LGSPSVQQPFHSGSRHDREQLTPCDQRLTEMLAKLAYPGFSYLRARALEKNPYEVLLTTMRENSAGLHALRIVEKKRFQWNPVRLRDSADRCAQFHSGVFRLSFR
jgi:hypothetical protein